MTLHHHNTSGIQDGKTGNTNRFLMKHNRGSAERPNKLAAYWKTDTHMRNDTTHHLPQQSELKSA